MNPLKTVCREALELVSDVISGYISGNIELRETKMTTNQRKSLSAYRDRLKREGIVRVEVHVREQDAPLIRGAAKALSDPELEGEARALLREHFAAGPAKGFKRLLAAAPLEGIDLSRDRDAGRDLDL